MRKALLVVLVASVLLPAAACTVAPTNLHPIAGTREGTEQFKDDSSD
ncbi:MAG: hypothetical protein ACM30I_16030 [Gemmatimonas sp.]